MTSASHSSNPTPASFRFEHLFGHELQDAIARLPLAWVPLGILEKHGEHLPYGLDATKAHEICLHLSSQLGGVVLPPTHLAGVQEPLWEDAEAWAKVLADA